MELIAKLEKPFVEKDRLNFIVEYNHNNGFMINETENSLEAWDYSDDEKTKINKEQIANLYLTRADVERGIYKAKGMDFEDIVEMVENIQKDYSALPQNDGELTCNGGSQIDIKALKIELKANNFYRGNPYVLAIGSLLGFSEEQLDKFFKDGNYEHLLV